MAYIRKLRSGKWQCLIRRKGYPYIAKSFLEKSTCSKYTKMIESQMDRKIFEDLSGAEGTTLRALIIKYRDEIVPEYKGARTLTYKLNLMLKYKICYYNLLQLNSSHINKFKKEIALGRAPKTVNMYIQTLQTIWNIARSQWAITLPALNPFALVTYNKVMNERDVTLNDDEFKRLLEESSKSKLNVLTDMIKFASITAARYAEITGLLRCNTDLNKKTATFIDTKNGENRTIPLHDDAIAILKKYPFGDKFFNVKTREIFRNYYDKAREAAGLPNFRFHDLRSFAIKKMLLSGMSEIKVAAISGHKTLAILHRRYSRIKAEDLIEEVNNVVNLK
jgi:integrase